MQYIIYSTGQIISPFFLSKFAKQGYKNSLKMVYD